MQSKYMILLVPNSFSLISSHAYVLSYLYRLQHQNELIQNAMKTIGETEQEGESIMENLQSNKELIKSSQSKVKGSNCNMCVFLIQ